MSGRSVSDALAAELDPYLLLEAASKDAQLDDYGDQAFVAPMTRWLEATAAEGYLNPAGVMGVAANVNRLLVNRLRFQEDLKRHPEILDEDVSDPVVIVGLPRTGTSKLQRMLSRHPSVQQLAFWRLLNVAPLPESQASKADPRIAVAKGFVDVMVQQFPDFMAGHPTDAEEPDEEVFLLEMTFESFCNAARMSVPSYLSWLIEESDDRDSPTYLRKLLQYLQWQDGGRQGRPWILKSPVHLGQLDSMLATFPDATFVYCHRDPAVALPSMTRVTEIMWRMVSDHVDLTDLGNQMLRFWSDVMAKDVAQRARLGNGAPILDVGYEQIREDALAVISEVFRLRGQELTPEAERSMLQWANENPQYRHGKHTYSLDRFGFTRSRIEDAFGSYFDGYSSYFRDH